MRKKVYVVGGDGYVGRRLVPRLHECYDVEVVDPGYLVRDEPDKSQDVTAAGYRIPEEPAVVVWLACVHRLPAEVVVSDERHRWEQYAFELMCNAPGRWLRAGHQLIYLSSMQVVSQAVKDLYAQCKLTMERCLVGSPGARVIRPGTVWGALRPNDPSNRVHTVPNKYITTGELPDDNWRAFTTHMHTLVGTIGSAVYTAEKWGLPGDVQCVTDRPRPWTAHDLSTNWGVSSEIIHVKGVDLGVSNHPMERLARHRKLPWVS